MAVCFTAGSTSVIFVIPFGTLNVKKFSALYVLRLYDSVLEGFTEIIKQEHLMAKGQNTDETNV